MGEAKKNVCFIAQHEKTCDFVAQQLLLFLSKYINVKTWCLQRHRVPPGHFYTSDIYIASSNTVLEAVRDRLPAGKTVMVAARTINIENLDKLLEFEPGTRALVVANSEETAVMAINLMISFGVNYLELLPYYPGSPVTIPGDIRLAITTGLAHLVPGHIDKVVDLGVKGIDLSTFARLLEHLEVSIEVLNDISHHYLEAILGVSLKHQKMARLNETLKKNMEVILNTVNDAIVAVNNANQIVMFNPAAERLLGMNSGEAIGQNIEKVIPPLDFPDCLKAGESVLHEIKRINDSHYIITVNPIHDQPGLTNGAVVTLRPVDEVRELETKVRRALKKKGNIARHTFAEIIGQSAELKKAVELAKKFAQTEMTILLEGESGTGKELFAQAIHNHSVRKKGPFVALNFAALPENLVESELFGYEDGAFTGAKRGGRQGLFEEAHLGTIFLDEIGDSSPEVQKKLLRVLEEREIRRVGGSTVTPIDVRIIAATNQNLESLVKAGKFRADLFYRLCALPVSLPPLRSRNSDIILLINYFANKHFGRELTLDPALREFFLNCTWEGNVRELENVVKYMCSVVGNRQQAGMGDLPPYLLRNSARTGPAGENSRRPGPEKYETLVFALQKQDSLEPVSIILEEIRNCSVLNTGIGRQTLLKKLKTRKITLSDYKVRQWLKMLSQMGYIDSGVTRQGCKITRLGEDFLSFLEAGEVSICHIGR
ncbi:MAG: sigma-54 interaction domain-containing protein [Bacillota bacterium]